MHAPFEGSKSMIYQDFSSVGEPLRNYDVTKLCLELILLKIFWNEIILNSRIRPIKPATQPFLVYDGIFYWIRSAHLTLELLLRAFIDLPLSEFYLPSRAFANLLLAFSKPNTLNRVILISSLNCSYFSFKIHFNVQNCLPSSVIYFAPETYPIVRSVKM